eukprot:Clim_evm18s233 gene=Clim_evmTU18s233
MKFASTVLISALALIASTTVTEAAAGSAMGAVKALKIAQGQPGGRHYEMMEKRKHAGKGSLKSRKSHRHKPYKCKHGAVKIDDMEYPCNKIDMWSYVSREDLGCVNDYAGLYVSDIWGWTDPEQGRDYAIITCVDGTSYVDVTEPWAPDVVAFTPTTTDLPEYSTGKPKEIWHDVKTFGNYAFIGSEEDDHGIQVVDLTKLRQLRGRAILNPETVYTGVGASHNVVINEDSARLYPVGARQGGTEDLCAGGLHAVDISEPTNPKFLGCAAEDGYTHDAQCVVYDGPDARYQGAEICFAFNEDTFTIWDVTDAANPIVLSRVLGVPAHRVPAEDPLEFYDRSTPAWYTHQGWASPDLTFLLADDELDEEMLDPRLEEPVSPNGATTYAWDITDLECPKMISTFTNGIPSIDHNQYIMETRSGLKSFQANYLSGLRVLDAKKVGRKDQLKLREEAFFDIAPDVNTVAYGGAWSVYPYFTDDKLVVSSIEDGLFVLSYKRKSQ